MSRESAQRGGAAAGTSGNAAGVVDLSSYATSTLSVSTLNLMKRGTKVLKLGRVGRPHNCYFHLTPTEDVVEWYNEKKRHVKKMVMLKSVVEMRRGQMTAVFDRHASSLSQYGGLSFSLVFLDAEGKEKTLDIVAENSEDYATWTLGLSVLLSRLAHGGTSGTDGGDEDQSAPTLPRAHARTSMRYRQQQAQAAQLQAQQAAQLQRHMRAVSQGRSPSSNTNNDDDDDSTEVSTDDGSMSSTGANSAPSANGHGNGVPGAGRGRVEGVGASTVRLNTEEENIRLWQLGNASSFDTEGEYKQSEGEHASVAAAPAMAVDDVGDLYVWGHTSFEESHAEPSSGEPDRSHCHPHRLESLNEIDVYRISCGSRHIAVIDDCGDLYLFGDGGDGQLGVGYVGDGGRSQSSRQGKVAHRIQEDPWLGGGRTDMVSCGRNFAAVATDRNQLFVWGENRYGQLGVGSTDTYYTPQKLDIFRDDARSVAPVEAAETPRLPSLASMIALPLPVLYVSCGASHMAAITSNYELYTWGESMFGALGHVEEDEIGSDGCGGIGVCAVPRRVDCLVGLKTVIVCCGVYHTLAIVLEDERMRMYNDAITGAGSGAAAGARGGGLGGCVFAWGDNSKNQLGIGKKMGKNDKAKVRYRPTEVALLSRVPVVSIAAGQYHSVALSASGEVYTWGCADDGKLGHGSVAGALPPSANVKQRPAKPGATGSVAAPSAPVDNSVPNRIESLCANGVRITQIACGLFHSAAIGVSGGCTQVFTWGLGLGGRLGSGSEKSNEVPTLVAGLADRVVRQVHCGDTWTAAICEHVWEPPFDTRSAPAHHQQSAVGAGAADAVADGARRRKVISIGTNAAGNQDDLSEPSSAPVSRKGSLTTAVDLQSIQADHANSPATSPPVARASSAHARGSSLQASSSSPLPLQLIPPGAGATPIEDMPLHQMDPQRAKTKIELDYYKQQYLEAKAEGRRMKAGWDLARKQLADAKAQLEHDQREKYAVTPGSSSPRRSGGGEVGGKPSARTPRGKKMYAPVVGAVECLQVVSNEESAVNVNAARRLSKIAKSLGSSTATRDPAQLEIVQEISDGIYLTVYRKRASEERGEASDGRATTAAASAADASSSVQGVVSSIARLVKSSKKTRKYSNMEEEEEEEEGGDGGTQPPPTAPATKWLSKKSLSLDFKDLAIDGDGDDGAATDGDSVPDRN